MQIVLVYVIVFLVAAVAVFYFLRRLGVLRGGRREDGCGDCPLKEGCGKRLNKTSASGEGCGCSSCGCDGGSE